MDGRGGRCGRCSGAGMPLDDLPDVRHDGFGFRRIAHDRQFGRVEILELTAALGTPAAEQAIRACAARQAEARAANVARVVRMARTDRALTITTLAAPGVPLADLLAALEFGTVSLDAAALLEVAVATTATVAAMHALPGAPVHGALSPSHVVLGPAGAVLTGTVFAEALQGLQWNREQLWRVFGLAMPSSASLPRFDQRADVTQMGALVLATLLRRTLGATEYPKQTIDLVDAAADGLAVTPRLRTPLRLWLQQVFQLQPKARFASGVDAARAFADVLVHGERRPEAVADVQRVLRALAGEPANEAPVQSQAPAAALPPPPPAPASSVRPRRGLPFLRSIFWSRGVS